MSIFSEINGSKPQGGEEVEGMFQCQERGCFDIEETAVYYSDLNRLEWTCEEGHENSVEDFNIG